MKREKRLNPVMTMIVPGRRALGEDWRKVTVYPTAEGKYELDNVETAAPADNKPIYVPALGNISVDMADFLLEAQRKEAEYRQRRGDTHPWQPTREEISQLFHEYMEQRLKWFKGQTVSGPAGWTQRERIRRTK